MEKYYSSVLSAGGLMCNFKILCERHPECTFYIIPDGTDFEREIFFAELVKSFKGYAAVQYVPFYDEKINGIFLKSFNTYILAESAYSKVSLVPPYCPENVIHLSRRVKISQSEKNLLAKYCAAERRNYRQAVQALALSAACAENRSALLSDYIVDERLINALRRIFKKIPLGVKRGKPTVKLISAATPLGVHTLWDTVYGHFDNVIELEDFYGFASAAILGVIRDKLISENEEFTFIPDLLHRTIPQMLLLPSSGTALVRTDDNHSLPFAPTHRINTDKFLLLPRRVREKCNLLNEAQNGYTEKAVAYIFEGADIRRKTDTLLLPYGKAENAAEKARELYLKITQ